MAVAVVNNTINQDTFVAKGRKSLKAEIQDVAVIDLMMQVVLNVAVVKSSIAANTVVAVANRTRRFGMNVVEGRKFKGAETLVAVATGRMTRPVLNAAVVRS